MRLLECLKRFINVYTELSKLKKEAIVFSSRYSCFIALYWFLLYNQLRVYLYSLLSLPPVSCLKSSSLNLPSRNSGKVLGAKETYFLPSRNEGPRNASVPRSPTESRSESLLAMMSVRFWPASAGSHRLFLSGATSVHLPPAALLPPIPSYGHAFPTPLLPMLFAHLFYLLVNY